MAADERELGRMLRAWRDRADPEDAGARLSGQRRTPGLRREDVAARAGLSVDYLTRLEQGRAVHPSAQVLAALARALMLSTAERDHLFVLSRLVPPGTGVIDSHITPGIQRMTERMRDLPVAVFDAAWTFVSGNTLFTALMGEPSGESPRERNLAWRFFTGTPFSTSAGRVIRSAGDKAAFEAEMVADLRRATGRYPDDAGLQTLIDELILRSERFAELWARADVAVRASDTKTIDHPELGSITLDCDVLTVQGSDLRLVVYSAPAGSDAAEKLKLLGVIGSGISGSGISGSGISGSAITDSGTTAFA